MKLISLFSGIGGFELAAEWMGWTPVVSCEINSFGKKVLEHYWPQAYHHTDIKTLTYEKINEELTKRFGAEWRSDDIILTGGFPCQPYSMAGKRLGKEDDRHLWPEMCRIIREVQPTWIVGENVFGLVNWNGGLVFHEVQTDLEAQGYEVQPYVLPACAVNAPHRRDRVWFVAYRETDRLTSTERTYEWEKHQPNNRDAIRTAFDTDGSVGDATNTDNWRARRTETRYQWKKYQFERSPIRSKYFASSSPSNWHNFPTQSPICSRNDGLSYKLDGITFSKWRNESIKAYGNAIVPQVALQIFKAIQAYQQ